MKKINLLITTLILITVPTIPQAVEWNELTDEEQKVLKRFEDRWNTLDELKQDRLRNGAERWKTMTPEQKAKAKQRFQRWQNIFPTLRPPGSCY